MKCVSGVICPNDVYSGVGSRSVPMLEWVWQAASRLSESRVGNLSVEGRMLTEQGGLREKGA